MNKRFLIDFFPIQYSASHLHEAMKNNGLVSFKTILQRADAENQNGRVYPKEILIREAEKYNNSFVKNRSALGELDHPEERTVVNLQTASHNIVEMHWEGDDLMGTVEVLNTPAGNIVKELMKAGIRLGISSRGVGSVIPISENTVEVGDDFNLICFDIVSNPSTQGAFLSENVKNSLEINRSHRINSLVNDFFIEIGSNNDKIEKISS